MQIAIDVARTERDWSEVRRLIHEYVEWAVPATGVVNPTEVQPHIAEELRDLSRYYASRGSVVFLARAGDEPVGMVGMHHDGDAAEVVRMYVRPGARGQGVARALLDALKEDATLRGARRLQLETEPISMATAVRLYERYGFRSVGTHDAGPLKLLAMELPLE